MTYPKTYYAATAHPAPARPALWGDESCDVCIIGAGYSGLSTGLHLAERGYKVIILEAEKVGFGASGRNGGQLINGFSRDYDVIRARYGHDTAEALLNLSFEGGDIIRQFIDKYKINCDYRPGSLFAAFTAPQMKELARKQELWSRAGNKDIEMYDRSRIPELVDTNLYCGGLLDRKAAHLHSLNLVLGEAAAIESLGGKIFEQSRVIRIENNTAHTKDGAVRAKYIVVCGNAYLDILPQLTSRIMSVSSQVVTTEVLGPELTHKMMPANVGVEDCNFLLDYYRITADHRLLFGGGVVYSGAEPADIIRRLQPHIVKTFPSLKDNKIDFAWSGNFALTLTRMPHLGRLNDTTYFIQGDSGHGLAPCHLFGKLVAEALDHQAARFDIFANMRNFPFPGGKLFRVPLTALGAWYYGLREKLGI